MGRRYAVADGCTGASAVEFPESAGTPKYSSSWVKLRSPHEKKRASVFGRRHCSGGQEGSCTPGALPLRRKQSAGGRGVSGRGVRCERRAGRLKDSRWQNWRGAAGGAQQHTWPWRWAGAAACTVPARQAPRGTAGSVSPSHPNRVVAWLVQAGLPSRNQKPDRCMVSCLTPPHSGWTNSTAAARGRQHRRGGGGRQGREPPPPPLPLPLLLPCGTRPPMPGCLPTLCVAWVDFGAQGVAGYSAVVHVVGLVPAHPQPPARHALVLQQGGGTRVGDLPAACMHALCRRSHRPSLLAISRRPAPLSPSHQLLL